MTSMSDSPPATFESPPSLGPRGVAVLLFGHPMYIDFTKKLALSMKLHSPNTPTAVITGFDDPTLANYFDHVLPHRPEFGKGVIQKLSLDRYAPFDQTVFIDCDCLVYGSLENMWDQFGDRPVGVFGTLLTKGHWYADVATVIAKANIPAIARTNTGFVYVRRGEAASRVFERARELIPQYHDFGFKPFRDHISDEPLLALALAEQDIDPVDEGRDFYVTMENVYGPIALDVMRGHCRFIVYSFDTGTMTIAPTNGKIIHFPGRNRETFIYRRELWRLSLWEKRGWSPQTISRLTAVPLGLPYAGYAFGMRLLKTIRVLNRRRPHLPYAMGFSWP